MNLTKLINPKYLQKNINLKNFSNASLTSFLEKMIFIRFCEEKLAEERKNGRIGGPVHLGAGQEAIAVGISEYLTKEDKIFGAHRSHSHILSLNQSAHKLFAEVLGKETGFSKGMGGSMHLIDKDSGFMGSVPIVSGTVALAVGAGFYLKRLEKKRISVVYLGDGAMEEGVVHESLNLANILPSPILFVVENNLFSSHMHISLRQPSTELSRFAKANDIKNDLVDGNDIIKMSEVAKKMIGYSRKTGRPSFIEAITYRHYGHVDWRKDIDVGVNRSKKDIELWLKRDPILRLSNAMLKSKIISENKLEKIKIKTSKSIDKAWKKASSDPYPEKKELLKRVYFEK